MSIKVTKITDFSIIKKMAEEGYLYVINNTATYAGNNGSRGVYHMTVKDENGEQFDINLPSTWVPIDIATMCNPMTVFNSQNFRKNVSNNYLVVVAKEQALKIINSPEAKTEIAKIEKQNNNTTNLSNEISINTNSSLTMDKKTVAPENASVNSPPENATTAPANLSEYDIEISGIITEFHNNKISELEAIKRMGSMDNLPSDDFLKTMSNSIGGDSTRILQFIGAMIGADSVPRPEEVFGADYTSALSNISIS